MSTMIKAEHLTFRYPDEPADHPPVLDDINLEIAAGSFVAILGHNGSGKSTFAKHCNALLTPTQGKLWVDGLDTSDPDNLLAIRGTVGMVFQNPDNQIVASVVEEDVAFGPENMGIPPEEIRKRVDTALKMVGMYEWREHAPHLLSGGQKQRVAIARALMMDPDMLLFDEPTSSLDPQLTAEVLAVIKELAKGKMTMIIVTHEMGFAREVADKVLFMGEGRVIEQGPPQELFGSPKDQRVKDFIQSIL